MDLKPNGRITFKPTSDIIQNPYIGFLSFNHFRGEPLFSDCVEGKFKERYPVYPELEQKGREQGFYPDTEMAYIRMIWRDFEPVEGQYNFALTDDIIEKCIEHKQHLMFRLMPHTTRRQEDVPDWLKEQIPCPERPDDKRIKDSPSSPIFLEKFARAIKAFGERYDNNPVLYAVDVSLFGAWGEGEGYEKADKVALANLMDVYAKTFKNTFIFGQICAPEIIVEQNKKGNNWGWRADGFGNDDHMHISFPRWIYPMRDVWKTAHCTFESFWYMGEWARLGWDVDAIIDKGLEWHMSTFNNKSSTIPYKWHGAVQKLLLKMGYRFAIRFIEYPEQASAGDVMNLNLYVENRGVAPIYIAHPFTLRLKSSKYEKVYDTGIDIRHWLPGDTIEKLALELPKDIPSGEYLLQAGLIGEFPRPTIKFAFETEQDGEYYNLCKIEIK